MASINRRNEFRVSDNRSIKTYIGDSVYLANLINISKNGFYAVMPKNSEFVPQKKIQVEIPLANSSKSIWATGKVVYQTENCGGLGVGVELNTISKDDKDMLNELVEEGRELVLAKMLETILWQRKTATCKSPFEAPKPPVTEHTVPMFKISDLTKK